MKEFLKQMCYTLVNINSASALTCTALMLCTLFSGATLFIIIVCYFISGEILWRGVHVLIFLLVFAVITLAAETYIRLNIFKKDYK